METNIARWTYWLGVVCLVVAAIWRAVKFFMGPVPGLDLAPLSFFRASLLLFVASIATTTHSKAKGE